MKIEAYKVECCNRIVDQDEATGINPIEDMFDIIRSYPICAPQKTDIHICSDCYKKKVLVPAQNMVDRKKNEREYELKCAELGYSFKLTVMQKYWLRQRKNVVSNTQKKSKKTPK